MPASAQFVSTTANPGEIIVVDNGSSDASPTVIRNSENLGFAAACNRGAAVGGAPYLTPECSQTSCRYRWPSWSGPRMAM